MGHFPTRLSQFYFKTLQTDIMYLSFTHRQPTKPDYWPAVPIKRGLNDRNAKYHLKEHIPPFRHVTAPLPNMTNENVPELIEIVLSWQYPISASRNLTDDQLASVYLQQLLISGVKPGFRYPLGSSVLGRKLAGRPHGVQTVFRGPFMYDFLDKMTNLVLPKWKNWYGFNKGGNHQGDMEIQLPANVIGSFPELELAYDQLPSVENAKFQPMQILFKTNAPTDWMTRSLLSSLGLPFIDIDGVKEKKKLELNMGDQTKKPKRKTKAKK